jgi:hypothetical protein
MMYAQVAVNNLRPNTEWSMSGDEADGIVWITQGVKPITAKELQDEIARIKAVEAQQPALKAALLDRLGITADEAKLLLA